MTRKEHKTHDAIEKYLKGCGIRVTIFGDLVHYSRGDETIATYDGQNLNWTAASVSRDQENGIRAHSNRITKEDMKVTIAINPFAKRQTANSEFSHFTGTWEELLAIVNKYWHKGVPGFRPGVVRVPVPPDGFFSGVVTLTPETKLTTQFAARRTSEQPFLQSFASVDQKQPAKFVEIIVYSHGTLKESDDATDPNADYEIVSINASESHEPTPPTPVAMARNLLGLAGGSKTTYTADEFAKSIIFWSTHAMCQPDR